MNDNQDSLLLDPKDSALLVIDMQKGYCHPDSAMNQTGPGTKNQQAIVPNVRELVDVCRRAGLPVLWSQQVHFPDDAGRKAHRIPAHTTKRKFVPCLRGTWEVEFVDGLRTVVRPEDHVFEKHRATCFYNTTLETKLRMLGARSLIISGVNTNYCVESTIRDAYFRDYDVYVVKDCVAGSDEELHKATLRNVELYFGLVLTLDDVVRTLQKNEPGRGG